MIHGAEAAIDTRLWSGRPAVAKTRVAKGYRDPELDRVIRDERTRDEAALLLAARRAGVPVPILYDIDRQGHALLMEQVDGPALREVAGGVRGQELLGVMGQHVGRLHRAGLCHGDLTTSNVLVSGGGLVFIDFGLGRFSVDAEDRAVDLHLLEEALVATEDGADALFEAFWKGYATTAPSADETLRRLEAVRERGRYRGT